MRNYRGGFGWPIADHRTQWHHRTCTVTYIILVHVRNIGTEQGICLYNYVEGTAVGGKIVNIQATHIGLDGGKHIRNVHAQFFAFFTIDR